MQSFSTSLFLTAFGMGIAFCAPPGMVLAEALRRGSRGGFSAALAVELGSLVGDAIWAVLGLAGVGLLLQLPRVQTPFTIVGIILLAWLGIKALIEARSGQEIQAAAVGSRGAFATGAALSLINPQSVVYWIALGGTIAPLTGRVPTTYDFMVFFAGFMAACTVYCFVVAALINTARRRLSARVNRVTNGLCAVAFFGFALQLARSVF